MNFIIYAIAASTVFIQGAVAAPDNDGKENLDPSPIEKVYYLDKNFYKKAGEWVLRRDGVAKDTPVRITIRGFLSAIDVDVGQGVNALFLSDPRQGRLKPLLHLKAPIRVHEKMNLKHRELTGTDVEEVTAEDIALMAELRERQLERGGNPFR